MDDAALLTAYTRHGDSAAFAEFTRRHVDLVYSAALRQAAGRHHDAQEITQQVFLAVARRAARLARHPALLAWLHLAVRQAARNHHRSVRRRQRLADRAAPELASTSPAAPEPDWKDLAPILDDALATLPEADRHAVLLRYFAEKPFAEVGRSLGLAENTARMRTERALDKLRAALARRGVTSTASALGVALGQHAVSAAPAGMATLTSATVLSAASLTASGSIVLAMSTSKWLLATATLVVGFTAGSLAQRLGAPSAAPSSPPSAQRASHPSGPANPHSTASANMETTRIRALESELARTRADLERLRFQSELRNAAYNAYLNELDSRQKDATTDKTAFANLTEAGAFAASLNQRTLAFFKKYERIPPPGSPEADDYKHQLEEITRDAALFMQDPLLSAEIYSENPERIASAQLAYLVPSVGLDPAQQTAVQQVLRAAYDEGFAAKLDGASRPEEDDTAWTNGRAELNARTVEKIKALLTPDQRVQYERLGFNQLLFVFQLAGL